MPYASIERRLCSLPQRSHPDQRVRWSLLCPRAKPPRAWLFPSGYKRPLRLARLGKRFSCSSGLQRFPCRCPPGTETPQVEIAAVSWELQRSPGRCPLGREKPRAEPAAVSVISYRLTLFCACRYKRTAGGLWETTGIAAHAICESRLRTHALRKNRRYLPIFVARIMPRSRTENAGQAFAFGSTSWLFFFLSL